MTYKEWLDDLSKDKSKNIFLNIPYVDSFLSVEVAYWTTLTFFGLKPVFASDYRRTGHRLQKIDAVLKKCGFSISDLSVSDRIGNICFEMGYMVRAGIPCQPFLAQRYHRRGGTKVVKFDEMLSDYKMMEPIVYEGDIETLIKKLSTWIHDNPGMRTRKKKRHDSHVILTACSVIERLVRKEKTPERAERYARIKAQFKDILNGQPIFPTTAIEVHFIDHKVDIRSGAKAVRKHQRSKRRK